MLTKKQKIVLFCGLVTILIGIDQLTKEIARDRLKGKDPVIFLNDFFRFDYAENTGAFLSFGDDWPPAVSFWLMNMLPLVLLIGIMVFALRKIAASPFSHLLPYLLIAAGGLGNITDRLLFNHHVTDFMNMGIGQLRTGIFNVADLYVTGGAIVLLYQQFGTRKKPVSPEHPVRRNSGLH